MNFDLLFQDLYSIPAIPIRHCQGEEIFRYTNNDIKFKYNIQGYRSKEFDQISDNFVLVSGCSHTEGHGLNLSDTWANLVADSLSLDLVNLAKGGSGADFVSQNIFNWMSSGKLPKIVIAQWPNPFRFMQWPENKLKFVIAGSTTIMYDYRLKYDEFGFWANWTRNIIFVDHICREKNIPILHLCFEEKKFVNHAVDVLKSKNIELHIDEKLPGKTWHFDSQAADGQHHSPNCQRKWADRILTLAQNHLQ